MAISAFDDKSLQPTDDDLRDALGRMYRTWVRLIDAVSDTIGPVSQTWGFTSKSTGWGMRLRQNDRVILYMTPQAGRFLVSFALGEKAVAAAHAAKLPAKLLDALDAAPRYAEGRGLRIEITSSRQIPSLATLARVKFEN